LTPSMAANATSATTTSPIPIDGTGPLPQNDGEGHQGEPVGEVLDRDAEREPYAEELMAGVEHHRGRRLGEPAVDQHLEREHDGQGHPVRHPPEDPGAEPP